MQETRGLLVIWLDVVAEHEEAWGRSHVREKLPDRVALPGILRGRRYSNPGRNTQRHLLVYDATHVEAFQSEEYRAAVSAPTERTRRVGPLVRNFTRGACEILVSRGSGLGGVMATIRFQLRPHVDMDDVRHATQAAFDSVGNGTVTRVYLAADRHDVTGIPSTERDLRDSTTEGTFDAVLFMEGTDPAELEEQVAGLMEAAGEHAASGSLLGAVYRLTYSLTQDDWST